MNIRDSRASRAKVRGRAPEPPRRRPPHTHFLPMLSRQPPLDARPFCPRGRVGPWCAILYRLRWRLERGCRHQHGWRILAALMTYGGFSRRGRVDRRSKGIERKRAYGVKRYDESAERIGVL